MFAHEVMHCILGHIDRATTASVICGTSPSTYATNLLLLDFKLILPKNGLWDYRYRGLTAEQIYTRLLANGFTVSLNRGPEVRLAQHRPGRHGRA